jgi:GNAT superfamily N-acetyltransferase
MQIGFARVVSDFTGFAYIADVFILPEHRKKGLSKWLMSIILSYPELQNMRRWMLATKDAHSLYEKFGFTALKNPKQFMELHVAEKNPY